MNLAAFAIVAFLRNAIGSEEIADYAGLVRTLAGLDRVHGDRDVQPGGAAAAGRLFRQVGRSSAPLIQAKLWTLLLIGVLNTVLSLFYYLRVVKVMVFSPEPLYRDAPEIPLTSMVGSYCLLLTLPGGGVVLPARRAAGLGQRGRLRPLPLNDVP